MSDFDERDPAPDPARENAQHGSPPPAPVPTSTAQPDSAPQTQPTAAAPAPDRSGDVRAASTLADQPPASERPVSTPDGAGPLMAGASTQVGVPTQAGAAVHARVPTPSDSWPLAQPPRGPAPVTAKDGAVAVIVALVVAALGAPLALLWSVIGPHVEVVMTSGGALLGDYNTEAFVGGDATFGAIGIGAGVLVGALAWLLRRWRGPVVLVGLAIGSVAGAWITWKLGHRIGLDGYNDLVRNADVGERFEQPMKLRSQGLVFLQATVAVIVYVVNAAWSHRGDLGTQATPDAAFRQPAPHQAYAVVGGPAPDAWSSPHEVPASPGWPSTDGGALPDGKPSQDGAALPDGRSTDGAALPDGGASIGAAAFPSSADTTEPPSPDGQRLPTDTEGVSSDPSAPAAPPTAPAPPATGTAWSPPA